MVESEVIITVLEPKDFDIFKLKDEKKDADIPDVVVAFVSDDEELVHRFADFFKDLLEERKNALENDTFKKKYLKKFEPFVNVLLKAQTYYDVKDAEEYESVQGIYIALIMQYATFISTIPKDIVGHFWKESDDRYIFTVGTKKLDTETIKHRFNEKISSEKHDPLSYYEFHFDSGVIDAGLFIKNSDIKVRYNEWGDYCESQN